MIYDLLDSFNKYKYTQTISMQFTEILYDICHIFTNIYKSVNCFFLCMFMFGLVCWSVFACVYVERQKILDQEMNFYEKNYKGTCITIDSEIIKQNICNIDTDCIDIYSLYIVCFKVLNLILIMQLNYY